MATNGTTRRLLESLQCMARLSGITLEQAADVYDAIIAIHNEKPDEDASATPPVRAPKGVQ